MLSQSVMWAVDGAMVGHVGKTEIAAVGLGGIVVWTLYSFFVGLSYSVSTFAAQNHGAREFERCGSSLRQGLYVAAASGLFILALRSFNAQTIALLGPDPSVQRFCLQYTDIRMLSGPFFIIQYTYSNFFRGIGDTRTPMKVAILANVANVVLDYMLIFGKGPFPAMGVAGAAWATFVANVISAGILATVSLSSEMREAYMTHRGWRPDMAEIRRLLGVGIPIGVHFFLDIGSFLVFSAYIGRMGTEQLAANQIMIQILALSFMPCQGFSIAATTLMGQYIGAATPDVAQKAASKALRLGLFYTGLVAAVYVLFPGPLVRIFNGDPMVVWYGKRIVLMAAAFQIFDAIQMIAGGALRGAGDTKVPMVLAVGAGWLLFLPLSFVCGTVLRGGVVGAWAGATIYVVALGIVMLLRFRWGAWRKMRLVSQPPISA